MPKDTFLDGKNQTMHENIYTIAVLPAKENSVDELLVTLESLAEATRQEHGCIEYGFYRDSANTECVLSFERWVDQASEDAHWETPHLGDALRTLKPVLAGEPKIYKATKVI